MIAIKKSILLILLTIYSFIICAQSSIQKLPSVFVDCQNCDLQYYKQQLPYVNFVKDRRIADLYILFTNMSTGGNANNYTLYCNYINPAYIPADTLNTIVEANTSAGIERDLLLKQLKIAVLPILLSSKNKRFIEYDVKIENNEESNQNQKDKWNFWTFNVNGGGNASINSYQKGGNINSNLSANRTTLANRFEVGTTFGYNQNISDDGNGGSVKSFRQKYGAYSFYAASITNHFSIGYFATFWSATDNNLLGSVQLFPSIEYNFFPYSQANRRQFRVMYRNGYRFQQYYKVNYFDKIKIHQWMHSLVFSYSQVENWGSVSLNIGTFHYFNYSKNYKFQINPEIGWNIFKGFRLGIWNNTSIVNDQFFLPKEEASAIDLALGNTKAATNFEFNGGLWINYTFGSKYNNVVNVRFNLNDDFW